MSCLRKSLFAAVTATIVLSASAANACPTCKDNLAHDPAGASLARGYAYSILFMLSMPPLIFGGLSGYFYWEVRRARLAKQSGETQLSVDSH
jgi:hypothetical protein